MLRPVRMCKLDCVVPEDYKVSLIETLHKKGIAQIELLTDSTIDDVQLTRDAPLDRVSEVSMLLIRVHKIIDQLSVFEIKDSNLLEDFLEIDKRPKVKVDSLDYAAVISKAKQLLDGVEDRIQDLEQKKSHFTDRAAKLTEEIKKYKKLTGLNIDLSELSDSKYLQIAFASSPTHLAESVKKVESEVEGSTLITSSAGDEASLALIAPKELFSEALKYIKDSGADVLDVKAQGQPKQIVKDLERDYELAVREVSEAKSKLKKMYESEFSKLLAMQELLEIEKSRCEIFYSCGRTQHTVLVRLWVPKHQCADTEKIVSEQTDDTAFIMKDEKPEDAPVLLDNPGVLKHFESLVHLFGTPRYNEINPTPFILVAFSLFFGIMLTDAIYGVIIILLGLYIKKKYARYSDSANMAFTVLFFCGLFAILFGLLTGSYFGNLLATYILGTDAQNIALWIDPLYEANAIIFLVAVCAIGFVHLFVGFFLGMYDNFQKGNIQLALTEYASWFFLVIGGALVALSMFPDGAPILPSFVQFIGGLILGIGLLLKFKARGAMMFIDMIGLIGNTLSYARLLAMALTTAGIALSFNVLASLSMGIPYVGIIVALVVFIAGHVINILLNSLGAFIHSLRLQYVEWFGTFYEGGGLRFNPFKENRKYTILRN